MLHLCTCQVECEPVDDITIHIDTYRTVPSTWIRLSLKSVAGDAGITAVELAPASIIPSVRAQRSVSVPCAPCC